MNRAGFFDLIEDWKKQEFVNFVDELVERDSLRLGFGKAEKRSARARSALVVLLLGLAILWRVSEADAATIEQPSASGSTGKGVEPSTSTPAAAVSPGSCPPGAQWLAEAQVQLDSRDFPKALVLFQKAAADGQATAMDHLGPLYRDGKGVTQDYGKAREWFQKAIDAGDDNGMWHFGKCNPIA
jgi:hypothetical protein